MRSSTWFSPTSPIGAAPKKKPQSTPSGTTTTTTRSPGKGSPGSATAMSVSISHAALPLTVVASLRRSARVGSYGSYIGPVIRHSTRLSAVFWVS